MCEVCARWWGFVSAVLNLVMFSVCHLLNVNVFALLSATNGEKWLCFVV